MTEKTSTPEDSIHNLRVAIEAMRAEGLGSHVSLVEDGIWQIERLVRQVEEGKSMVKEACDLLTERTYGNPARSPGHNARLRLEGWSALSSTEDR